MPDTIERSRGILFFFTNHTDFVALSLMPLPGRQWWFITLGTAYSWLPGDHRGFRSKDHGIHSSGDYKNPPPEGEHEGLYQYHKKRHPNAVVIPKEARLIVAITITKVIRELGYRVIAVSVSDVHTHIVAELPIDLQEFKKIIGKVKCDSSRAIRKLLPGKVWSRGDDHDLIHTKAHRHNSFIYVKDKQGPWAAVWSCEGTKEAMLD